MISRDEGLHTDFACHLYELLRHRWGHHRRCVRLLTPAWLCICARLPLCAGMIPKLQLLFNPTPHMVDTSTLLQLSAPAPSLRCFAAGQPASLHHVRRLLPA